MARWVKFLYNTGRFRPKKYLIMLGCLLLFTYSIFFLFEIDSKSQKLDKIFQKNMEIEGQVNQSPYLLEEISELPKINIDTIIKLDETYRIKKPSEEETENPTSMKEDWQNTIAKSENVVGKYSKSEASKIKEEKIGESKPVYHTNHQNLYPAHIKIYNRKSARDVIVPNEGLGNDKTINKKQKHLFILGHYEQLGKTTINYLEAARLAYLMDRKIVKPFARNSRFCGLSTGWTGVLRMTTRAFFPLDLYYNVSSLQTLFRTYKLAEMEYLDTFKDSCSYENGNRKIRVIYFMFEKKVSMQVLSLSDEEHLKIEKSLNKSLGWTDCSFVNERIKINERIGGNVQIGEQLCVDPSRITDIGVFENEILKNDPCVILHQWRGIGDGRAHFKNLTHHVPQETYLRNLNPSDFVLAEVLRFLKTLGTNFIGVHIRSERQLLWYDLTKFSKCMDLVYREVKGVKKANNIKKVFISADIGPFGSDQISRGFNASEMKIINRKYRWLVSKLDAITFNVVREKHHVWTDSGFVALIQLHILSHAAHLVTLGSGTFQKWMTNTFKDRKSLENEKSWTITRTCFSEWKSSTRKTGRKKL